MNFKIGLALVCLLNLSAGVLLGVAGDRAFRFGPPPFGRHGSHGPGPGGPAEGISHMLGLSSAQGERVRAVFEKHRPEFESIMEDERARMRVLRNKTDDEVMPILTEDQRARFLEFRRDVEAREDAAFRGRNGTK